MLGIVGARARVTALAVAGVLATVATPAPAAPSHGEAPPTVLVVGDSLGQGIAKGLQRDGRLEVVNGAGVNCTIAGGILQSYRGGPLGPGGCADWRTRWGALVEEHQPDVVVVNVGGWEVVDRWFESPGAGPPLTVEDTVFRDRVIVAMEEATAILSGGGGPVVFLTTPYFDPEHPFPRPEPGQAVSEIWWEPYGPERPPERWQSPATGEPFLPAKRKVDVLNAIKEEFGDGGDAVVLDLNALASPGGRYTGKLDGKQVRHADRIHFNDRGYRLIADWLVPKLKRLA